MLNSDPDPTDTPEVFDKTPDSNQLDLNPISPSLREIRDNLQAGETEGALSAVEAILLERPLTATMQGKVLALAADSEYKRGAFEEAAEIQDQAAELTAGDPLLWLRPRIGQVLALLKAAKVEDAWQLARSVLAQSEEKMDDFHNGARTMQQKLRRGVVITVAARPQRVSVVASELGRLFLREGEIDAAKEFLNAAITVCPKGATRARESLAEIAMREGDPQTALQWAMQALMMGKLQAKTLHTLRLIVQIKRQLGDPNVSQELLAMVQTARPSVRARAILVLVQELRANGSEQWRQIAEQWLSQDGARFYIEAAELRKITLRENKLLSGDPEANIDAAWAVLAQPGVSPMEWLSAAKEYTRASWFAGRTPDLDGIVSAAIQGFGPDYGNDVAHSLALSTMMAKRHDIAIPWLEARVANLTPGTEIWGKGVWALARIEAYFERHQRAAHFYDLFAKSEAMPVNLKAQARLKWVRALDAAGDKSGIAAGVGEIRALLPDISDWSILLDVARQLRFAPGQEADGLAFEYFQKAEPAAIAAASATLLPAEAQTILLKLARRTTQDFHKPENTVAVWDGLSEERKLWLWSESATFWEYLSFVLMSMLEANKIAQADQLHSNFANDAGTPKIGKLYLLITYGHWCMENHKDQEGLALLSQALDLDANHELARKAHYWWALHYWDVGDATSAKAHAIKVRQDPSSGGGMAEDWKMTAKAEWILADGDESKLDPKMVAKFGKTFQGMTELR